MIGLKLYGYINQLPEEDLVSYKKFVSSPYFNSKQHIISLNDNLCKLVMRREVYDPHKLWRMCYGKKEYKEQTLKNALSDLKKLFDKFLAQVRFEEQEIESKIAALETSMRYFILDYYDSHAPRLGKLLDSGDELTYGMDYYKYRFRYFRTQERREAQTKNKYRASYVDSSFESLKMDGLLSYFTNWLLYN